MNALHDIQGGMDGQIKYDKAIFHGDWARCKRIANVVVQCAPTSAPLSILEIGCGTGEQLVTLAQKFPNARLTGVDISGPNIAIASDLVQRENLGDRIEVVQANYLAHEFGSFDVIVSYSTLHLIPAHDALLFSKLAGELAPGGVFINIIPYDCLFNRSLFLLRRVFRIFRGRATDLLVLKAGRLLTRYKISEQKLGKQLIYMYMLPERIEGRAMCEMLAQRYGLRLERKQFEPHASLAQPRHVLVAYRKDAS